MAGHLRVEDRDGPEPGAEPGVQYILVLTEVFCLDIRADSTCGLKRRFRCGFHHELAVREVVGRNPLAPPELAGDAPVVGVLHPVAVGIDVALGDELRAAALDRLQGDLRQGVHLQEPLGGELGLDDGVRPLGVAHRRGVVFHLHQVAGFLQHLHDLLAGDEAVLADEDLRVLVQLAVVVDDLEDRQVVAQADLVVVHVVRRGHLQAAGTEVHLHVIVLDHGDFAVDQRDQDLLAAQPVVALVVRVHADGGVGHDGLRTGGGDHEELVRGIAVAVGNVIAEVVEMALGVLVDDFVVTHGREGLGVPVHHPDALVDPSLAVEMDEGVQNRLAESRFHREAGAVPVAGATQLAELLQDDPAVLLLPFPGVLEEFLAADVLLGDAHGLELRDDLGFGGDGRVVRSRHPACVLAVHAGVADEDIVQGIVQDVTHVQDARHIGRRDHDRIGFLFIGFGMEELVVQPVGVPFVLHFRGIVLRC